MDILEGQRIVGVIIVEGVNHQASSEIKDLKVILLLAMTVSRYDCE